MADFRKLLPLAAACTLLGMPGTAQQALPDPANLTGEHIAPQALADSLPINHGAPALQQLLVKLRTRASMMLIVAHPDDEDGGFLTYESRGQGARVAMLTLTRGEGGQNLMSADFDDALGLIRTQELLAADRYEGVDQFFGTEVDFGFSKTKEETLAKWTHERVLYDAVRAVRLYRPLILASVFVGGVTDGHGHHQVSGEICQEVFLAAADPKVFPEMGLPPWAPLKVYARSPFARIDEHGMFDYATGKYSPVLFHNYVTGSDITHAPKPTVTIHEGEASTLLGMAGDTYIQFARKGLAQQKTQIGGGNARLAPSGSFDSGYTLMASRVCAATPCPIHSDSGMNGNPATEQTPFAGIDTSLGGIASLAPDAPVALRQNLTQFLADFDRLAASASTVFAPDDAAQTLIPLRAALTRIDPMLAEVQTTSFDATEKFNLLHELKVKRTQLNQAMLLALGVTADAILTAPANTSPTPGHAFLVQTTLESSTAAAPLQVLSATLRVASARGDASPSIFKAQPVSTPTLLVAGIPVTLTFEDRLPADTPVTRPVFVHASLEQPYYTIADQALRTAPAAPAPMVAQVILREESGLALEIESIVRTEGVQAPAVAQAAMIVPAATVSITPTAGIAPLNAPSLDLSTLTRTSLMVPGISTLKSPPQWIVRSDMISETSLGKLEKFTVKPRNLTAGTTYPFTGVATYGDQQYTESWRAVGYPGLTYTNLYAPATYKATAVDVTVAPGLKVAYLPGTGDSVADFLPNLGVKPVVIGVKDLNAETLHPFDEVILGVRAYAAHPELAGKGSQPLLDYARAGGIVLVQYNTARYGDAEAPFPIQVPGDPGHNVVVEAQPVSVLVPTAPLLSWPNKITSADFRNWVAEYGHGFPASFDPHYTALLEVHDPEQDPQKGGLLVAPVGKGAYIYCALALYRQLPESVPGAYRLFANLLSYAKNPQR